MEGTDDCRADHPPGRNRRARLDFPVSRLNSRLRQTPHLTAIRRINGPTNSARLHTTHRLAPSGVPLICVPREGRRAGSVSDRSFLPQRFLRSLTLPARHRSVCLESPRPPGSIADWFSPTKVLSDAVCRLRPGPEPAREPGPLHARRRAAGARPLLPARRPALAGEPGPGRPAPSSPSCSRGSSTRCRSTWRAGRSSTAWSSACCRSAGPSSPRCCSTTSPSRPASSPSSAGRSAALSGDARVQAVLIGFCFGAFLEGAAGAGLAGRHLRGDAGRPRRAAVPGRGHLPDRQHVAGLLRRAGRAGPHARRRHRHLRPTRSASCAGTSCRSCRA